MVNKKNIKNNQIKGLSEGERRALLEELLRKKSDESGTVFSLSYGQRALWFINQVAPESPAYNITHMAYIRSEVDVLILKRTLQSLLDRHPALRTTYSEKKGKLRQQVHHQQEVHFETVDITSWNRDRLNLQLNEEADRPFNLEQGPMLRVKLYSRSSGKFIIQFTVHHIAVDFWSLEIILREFQALYDILKSGSSDSLKPLNTQYRDFVHYQADLLAGKEGERLWNFWQKQLGGRLPSLELTFKQARPEIQTFSGTCQNFKLSNELGKKLKEIAYIEGVTLFTITLAAFMVLLYRYSGQEDILVGCPTVGRSRTEFENIVGYFVNPIVLRADLGGNPTFKEFLNRVNHTVLDALDHQDYPFPLLVEKLQPNRDSSRSPIFQVDFVWEKQQVFQSESDGIQLEPFTSEQRGAQFDFTFRVFEIGDSLSVTIQYNSDLFDDTAINRMADHYKTLLNGIVRNQRERISDLTLLSEEEKKQILVAWNDTQVDIPGDITLHRVFENQVQLTPEACAVVNENEKLSYRELNDRANQLGHYLRNLGIGPDVRVAIFMERSLEMVIGIYGVLKAGGAYVPVDPEYPRDRISFILKDTRASILLTQQCLLEKLPDQKIKNVICLDKDQPDISKESINNPGNLNKSGDLAYVIYTSGSTGKPKGVMISHLAICNRIIWMQDYFKLTTEDRILQKTPFSFDVSVWEFFWPLLYGACLVVARPGGQKNSAYLVSLIREQKITIIHFVPSMLKVFLDEPGLRDCFSLKQVICSGEVLPLKLQEEFFSRLNAELYNLYGPTETAVDVTCWACKSESALKFVPIGKPISNIQIYLLDSHLQPVPIGVSGELYIGGMGLALGYINRPKLTAEKFIKSPFSQRPGDRLYKSGDLARYLPDGNIEFLGRMDSQVKIRGFRIEMGEIETIVREHPAVQEVVVVAREDLPDDKRLVAYVVYEQKPFPNSSEIKFFLREKLPEYMIPAVFVTMDALPLTMNGKVDRQALPVAEGFRPELETAFVAPRTEVERRIAGIWKEVLKVKKVGMNDNFFDLGGHSILMVQVHRNLQKMFKHDLSIMELFKYSTVSSMAKYLTQGKSTRQPLVYDTRINTIKEGKDRLKKQLKRKQRVLRGRKSADE